MGTDLTHHVAFSSAYPVWEGGWSTPLIGLHPGQITSLSYGYDRGITFTPTGNLEITQQTHIWTESQSTWREPAQAQEEHANSKRKRSQAKFEARIFLL